MDIKLGKGSTELLRSVVGRNGPGEPLVKGLVIVIPDWFLTQVITELSSSVLYFLSAYTVPNWSEAGTLGEKEGVLQQIRVTQPQLCLFYRNVCCLYPDHFKICC